MAWSQTTPPPAPSPKRRGGEDRSAPPLLARRGSSSSAPPPRSGEGAGGGVLQQVIPSSCAGVPAPRRAADPLGPVAERSSDAFRLPPAAPRPGVPPPGRAAG